MQHCEVFYNAGSFITPHHCKTEREKEREQVCVIMLTFFLYFWHLVCLLRIELTIKTSIFASL